VNNEESMTAFSLFMYAAASKTKTHLKVSNEIGSLYGLHQPHDKRGKPLEYPIPEKRKKIAFIKDENGNEIYKEATITIYEAKIESHFDAIREIIADDKPVSLEQIYIAYMGHEILHDIDEDGIQLDIDKQKGVENNYNDESKTKPITEEILKEVEVPKIKKIGID